MRPSNGALACISRLLPGARVYEDPLAPFCLNRAAFGKPHARKAYPRLPRQLVVPTFQVFGQEL